MPFFLFNMGMMVDVILTVAVVAVAAGAVTEFQIRVRNIGAAANCAAVGIRRFRLGSGSFIGAGAVEVYGALSLGGRAFLFEKPGEIDLPGKGDHIDHIFAEEQEIIADGHEGEQTVGEQAGGCHIDKTVKGQTQINDCKDPCLDRDDIQKQELGIGVHGGIAEEQT